MPSSTGRKAHGLLSQGVPWDHLWYRHQQRILRDKHFKAWHSRPGMKFVEVPRDIEHEVRAMANGKIAQRASNALSGIPARSPSAAVALVFRGGHTTPARFRADRAKARASNWGRHEADVPPLSSENTKHDKCEKQSPLPSPVAELCSRAPWWARRHQRGPAMAAPRGRCFVLGVRWLAWGSGRRGPWRW